MTQQLSEREVEAPAPGKASAKRRSSKASLALAVLMGVSLTFPLAVWLVGHSMSSPLVTEPILTPDVVQVVDGTVRPSRPVTLERHTTAGIEVLTSDSGRVTWIPPLGSELGNGDRAAIIDDRTVVGYTSASPLFRNLEEGASGNDVKALQGLLSARGFYKGAADGAFDSDVAQAVSAFNKQVNRSGLGTTFSLDSVAWLGSSPLIIDELKAPTGSSFGSNSTLFSGPALTAWVSIAGVSSQELESGAFQLRIPQLADPIAVENQNITDAGTLERVSELFVQDGPLPATLEAVAETPVKSVPASALVTSSTGNTCVYDAESLEPLAVTSVGGGNSTITFDHSFPLRSVIANPGQLKGLAPCA